jgi:hypothetical protein
MKTVTLWNCASKDLNPNILLGNELNMSTYENLYICILSWFTELSLTESGDFFKSETLTKWTHKRNLWRRIVFKNFVWIRWKLLFLKICHWESGCLVVVSIFYLYSCCSHLENRTSMDWFVSLQFLNLRRSVGLLRQVISLSQGHYLHTHTHRKSADKHPCLEWDSNPQSQCLSKQRHFMP